MTKVETTVLICGGGPTGLLSALLLARYGVPSVLVEAHAGTAIHPRARGLNVRTMEILRELGLEASVRQAGAALAGSRYMLFVESLAGREQRRVPDDELMPLGAELVVVTPCDWSQCAQDKLEPLLVAAAREHGADIRFATRLLDFSQEERGVSAHVQEQGGADYTIRAQFMIAADGSASAIRARLGVALAERGEGVYGPRGHFMNIYFQADLRELVADRLFGICFIERPDFEGVLLPVNNHDLWLLNVPYEPGADAEPPDFTPQGCEALVCAAVGLADLAPRIISALPWEAAGRLAERFQVGRVFLAGDAAHQAPPAGSFGLNTGVADAHNLAWKLALVIRGAADAELLASYEVERRPVAELVVGTAVAEFNASTPDTIPQQDGSPAEEPWDEADEWGDTVGGPPAPDLRERLLPVLGYSYCSTAVIGGDGLMATTLIVDGRPGSRAPHLWVVQDSVRRSLLDLFGRDFTLLAGVAGQNWCDAAREVGEQLRVAINTYRVGPAGDLQVEQGVWELAYGVDSAGAALVRPDGFVVWRSGAASSGAKAELGSVMTRILRVTAANNATDLRAAGSRLDSPSSAGGPAC